MVAVVPLIFTRKGNFSSPLVAEAEEEDLVEEEMVEELVLQDKEVVEEMVAMEDNFLMQEQFLQ